MPVFIVALFTVAKSWKRPKWPLANKWLNKSFYIYAVVYYSALRRKEILTYCNMDEPWWCYTKLCNPITKGQSWFCLYEVAAAAAAAKSLQSCLTLCYPIDSSPPGSPIPGILQAGTLEWGAISFSNAWKWKVKVKSLSRVRLLVTPRTAAYQAPPSMGFSRQEYWSGVPLPSPIWSS